MTSPAGTRWAALFYAGCLPESTTLSRVLRQPLCRGDTRKITSQPFTERIS